MHDAGDRAESRRRARWSRCARSCRWPACRRRTARRCWRCPAPSAPGSGRGAAASLTWSATRAHSSDSIAPSSAMVTVGTNSCLTRLPVEVGQREGRQRPAGCRRSGVPMVSTGSSKPRRHQRQRDQRDDRARHARRRHRAARASAEATEHAGARRRPTARHARNAARRGQANRPARQASAEAEGVGVEAAEVASPSVLQLAKNMSAGIFVDRRPSQSFSCEISDQHRDAVGEADHDRHRHVAHQRAEPEQPEQEQQHAGAARSRSAGWRRRSARRCRRR